MYACMHACMDVCMDGWMGWNGMEWNVMLCNVV